MRSAIPAPAAIPIELTMSYTPDSGMELTFGG